MPPSLVEVHCASRVTPPICDQQYLPVNPARGFASPRSVEVGPTPLDTHSRTPCVIYQPAGLINDSYKPGYTTDIRAPQGRTPEIPTLVLFGYAAAKSTNYSSPCVRNRTADRRFTNRFTKHEVVVFREV